jgi:RNA polymerase primary sigma factor
LERSVLLNEKLLETIADREQNDNQEEHQEEYPAVARLVDLGRKQGYVTIDDVLLIFPEAEREVNTLEEAFAVLLRSGIPYVDDMDTTQPSNEELAVEEEEDKKEKKKKGIGDDNYLANIDTDDMIGLYLKEVGRVPLLIAEEEVWLAKRIEAGRVARGVLASGKRIDAEERAQHRFNVEDGWAAREHLITANSRLVISVAKKYMGRGVPFQDLIQEGNIGLIRSAKKFDYRRGHKFSTYATWWIRQAVTRAIADQGRTIRVPVHMGDQINKLLRI